jgi:hypothetical protein
VLLRSPWVIRTIPKQPAVAAAALLFLCMSPGSRTSSRSGEALVGAPSQPAMTFWGFSPELLIHSTQFL